MVFGCTSSYGTSKKLHAQLLRRRRKWRRSNVVVLVIALVTFWGLVMGGSHHICICTSFMAYKVSYSKPILFSVYLRTLPLSFFSEDLNHCECQGHLLLQWFLQKTSNFSSDILVVTEDLFPFSGGASWGGRSRKDSKKERVAWNYKSSVRPWDKYKFIADVSSSQTMGQVTTRLYLPWKMERRWVFPSANFTPGHLKILISIWVFPKIGIPQNGWFITENPIKMDDLGGTPIFGNIHISLESLFYVFFFSAPQGSFFGC